MNNNNLHTDHFGPIDPPEIPITMEGWRNNIEPIFDFTTSFLDKGVPMSDFAVSDFVERLLELFNQDLKGYPTIKSLYNIDLRQVKYQPRETYKYNQMLDIQKNLVKALCTDEFFSQQWQNYILQDGVKTYNATLAKIKDTGLENTHALNLIDIPKTATNNPYQEGDIVWDECAFVGKRFFDDARGKSIVQNFLSRKGREYTKDVAICQYLARIIGSKLPFNEQYDLELSRIGDEYKPWKLLFLSILETATNPNIKEVRKMILRKMTHFQEVANDVFRRYDKNTPIGIKILEAEMYNRVHRMSYVLIANALQKISAITTNIPQLTISTHKNKELNNRCRTFSELLTYDIEEDNDRFLALVNSLIAQDIYLQNSSLEQYYIREDLGNRLTQEISKVMPDYSYMNNLELLDDHEIWNYSRIELLKYIESGPITFLKMCAIDNYIFSALSFDDMKLRIQECVDYIDDYYKLCNDIEKRMISVNECFKDLLDDIESDRLSYMLDRRKENITYIVEEFVEYKKDHTYGAIYGVLELLDSYNRGNDIDGQECLQIYELPGRYDRLLELGDDYPEDDNNKYDDGYGDVDVL